MNLVTEVDAETAALYCNRFVSYYISQYKSMLCDNSVVRFWELGALRQVRGRLYMGGRQSKD